MTLVVRDGIQAMFEFLEPFCTFYVYSHGLKNYIDLILEKIDPDHRFFKERHERVLAPLNSEEQHMMRQNSKSFTDFRKPGNKSQCLFTPAELQRTLIIDD